MLRIPSTFSNFKRIYWPLIKFRQTALLTLTGLAGFASAFPAAGGWPRLAALAGSLFLAVSGSTVLNMAIDRDIDARMVRTAQRPMAAGQVSLAVGSGIGALLLGLGLAWALALSGLYAAIVLAGSLIDVVVYTLWLKRRTAWSILPGGISGAMPILAGRALALGRMDAPGLLLALAIFAWIPAHNIILSIIYAQDYQQACLPTFLSIYGRPAARLSLVASCLLTVAAMTVVFSRLGLPAGFLWLLILTGVGLLLAALSAWLRPAPGAILRLYKYSSVYMLACMLLLALSTLAQVSK